ncbi:hypothetical protein [Streptomyces stackebrandtii]|uniref:hypothetical protein n=1 Tax=Streptomyces stackebrandtii TaxID=3051177 RepID=UPI0028DAF911|nr:hypothetical protein [Streptomyces sp. DSM 40976]
MVTTTGSAHGSDKTACAGLMLTAGLAASDTWGAVTGHHAPRTVSAAGLNLALNDMDAPSACEGA